MALLLQIIGSLALGGSVSGFISGAGSGRKGEYYLWMRKTEAELLDAIELV